MRLLLALPLVVLLSSLLVVQADLDDDEFAEFSQIEPDEEELSVQEEGDDIFETEPEVKNESKDNTVIDNEDDILVLDDDSEFEHLQDPEEFEGYEDAVPQQTDQPKINISKVPIKARFRLEAFWLEASLCCLLFVYGISYLFGKSKNTNIVTNFLSKHKSLLEDNFTLVGEQGEKNSDTISLNPNEGGFRVEADHLYSMWCSGRLYCEGMLVTLKLVKRQDLLHVLLNIVKPTIDTVQIRVELTKEDADPFVLCIAQKKMATKLSKEMRDLSAFCPERRPGDKHNLPSTLSVMSESAEATSSVLDSKTTQVLNVYHKLIQFIHISDQYCGAKQVDDTPSMKPPETEKVLLVNFNLTDDEDEMKALLMLVFHLVDKIKRLRLSKEALSKCEKRRQKALEAWQLMSHAARQEQAVQRREEKRKQEKERILAEDDPEKQRRWELKEQKRQLKRKTPKMKQLKVKAL